MESICFTLLAWERSLEKSKSSGVATLCIAIIGVVSPLRLLVDQYNRVLLFNS